MNAIPPDSLHAAAEALGDEITALRRAIHAEPELGVQTPKTMAKVRAALSDLDLEWREGPSTSGAIAVLKGGAGEGRRVLLRGDMDALEMPEETGLEFASTIAGRMHACGHDAHTAMVVGAAKLLAAQSGAWSGEVHFMFQPGEEGHFGAKKMIEDGLLDPKPDAAYAIHVIPNAPHGLIGARAGAIMVAADQLRIVVEGRGGHASMPHHGADPVPVACEIVTAIQTMVTRRFDAGQAPVVTITQLSAGSAHNVIPDRCTISGTMRTQTPDIRTALFAAVRQLADGIAGAHGLAADVVIEEGFPVTMNDARAVALAEKVTAERFGPGNWITLERPLMGAEDFSYVLQAVPGAMVFLGVSREGDDWQHACGLHSTKMHLDESVMPKGAALLAGLAIAVLEDGLPPGA